MTERRRRPGSVVQRRLSVPFAGMTRIRFKGSPRYPLGSSVSQPPDGAPLGQDQSSENPPAAKPGSDDRLFAHFGNFGSRITRLAQHLVGVLAEPGGRAVDRAAAVLQAKARAHDLDRAVLGLD